MVDRLAGLLRHYSLLVRVFHSGAFCEQRHYAALHGHICLTRYGPVMTCSPVYEDPLVTEPSLLFYPRVASHRFVTAPGDTAEQLRAEVDLGASAGNPLAMALPPMLLIPLADSSSLGPTLELLFTEAERDQCGRQTAISRLYELLLIQLLRYLMDGQLGTAGLLVDLADPKLVRAIITVHDAPQTVWSLEALATKADMSRAHSAAASKSVAGVTPDDCLAGWQMNVSCILLKQGRPVTVVAGRVGYGSPNVLARAFHVCMGYAPRGWLTQ